MSSNITNTMPYLRTSRSFPEDMHEMSIEMNKAYIDIANAVNNRTIGIFTTVNPSATGDNWFINKGQKQQSLRQVYLFDGTTGATLAHGLKWASIQSFTRVYGEFTDGTNWYGLISGSNVAIAGQVVVYIDPTNINFLIDAGAPTITRGHVVLEWLSNV